VSGTVPTRIRVLIVDDQAMVHSGIAATAGSKSRHPANEVVVITRFIEEGMAERTARTHAAPFAVEHRLDRAP